MSDTTHDPSSGAGDRSKYIRTYAKDVAALTGSEPVAGSEPRKTPPPTPAPPPPKKPSPWEMPKASQDTAKLYAAKEPEEERSVVLERLRNKLKQSAAIEVEDVAPAPERAPAPAPPPPPVFAEPPPPPPPVPPVPPKEAKPSPLHTYTSDFADRIDERKASTFSVLAAETDTKAPAKKASRRTVASTALAVLLFALGGIGIAGAAWYVVRLSATPLAPLSVPSLVFADERVKLSGTGRELMQQLAETAREPLVDGNVLVTYLSESTTTPKGEPREIPLAGGALIRALQLPAPDILLRNVSPASTVGIVSAGLETRPFFVFRVTSYERTFAGMLAWEDTLARDLELLYPAYGAPTVNAEASVINLGTSTPAAESEPPRLLPAFSDAVVASRDVRTLKDTAGNTVMLYGYADKATLILARDEAAFTSLIGRLTTGTASDN